MKTRIFITIIFIVWIITYSIFDNYNTNQITRIERKLDSIQNIIKCKDTTNKK